MKVVILAGGRGMRINEESYARPKPMIEIGDKPILWHIMKIYSAYGYNDFIICCGYRGDYIKNYFLNYYMYQSDVSIDLKNNSVDLYGKDVEPWKVTLVNTGINTNTVGRVMRIKEYVNRERFMLTYGDGVANVNIPKLIKFHDEMKKVVTITAAKPAGRWGTLQIDEKSGTVMDFMEKDRSNEAWVNGGFAVYEPEIFEYLEDETEQLEYGPYVRLSQERKIAAYKHEGFWHPMDTMRDRDILEKYWQDGNAAWKIW